MFGAILTAFLIESRKDLTPDPIEAALQAILQTLRNDSAAMTTSESSKPSRASLVVNATWFSSLALTLISALAAVLARGWLAKYTPATPGQRSSDACERHLRYLRAQQWRLGTIVGAIPFLIQLALFLFSVGLVIFTLQQNVGIGITLLVFTILATVLYFLSTFLPWFSPGCPFQTTMSDLLTGFIPGPAVKPLYSGSASGKMNCPRLPQQLSLRDQWNNFLKEAHRIPEQLETEANVLAWMLTNATNENSIEETVKAVAGEAVAGAKPNQYLASALMNDSAGNDSAGSILIHRFAQFVKAVPGLPIIIRDGDVGKVEAYFYAMLRIMGPIAKGDRNMAVFENLKSLLRAGQPLHRWEDYMDYFRPLAFVLRNNILVATRDDEERQWEEIEGDLTKLATMGLPPYTRLILVNTTAEGLLKGRPNVRKMCALVLARQLQIGEYNYLYAHLLAQKKCTSGYSQNAREQE